MLHVLILVRLPLLVEGIRSTLEQMTSWEVHSAWPGDPEAVAELAQGLQFDVTILDASSQDVFCLLEQLGKERVRLLGRTMAVTTGELDEEIMFRLMLWGVAAYLSTRTPLEDFVTALRRVSAAEWLLSSDGLPTAAPGTSCRHQQGSAADLDEGDEVSLLSARETTILRSIAQGMRNRDVARSLRISDQTVKNHITSIFKKLGVSDRTAAVVVAFRRGWIELPEYSRSPQADKASVA